MHNELLMTSSTAANDIMILHRMHIFTEILNWSKLVDYIQQCSYNGYSKVNHSELR